MARKPRKKKAKFVKNDVMVESADFDGVVVGKTPLDKLALYWALIQFDPDFRSGRLRLTDPPT